MARSKKAVKTETKVETAKYKYQCPACTNVAIRTTNKMLNVEIDCMSCGKRIKLENINNYMEL